MSPRPVTVTMELQVSLLVSGATALPVRATISYDEADPYAVCLSFRTSQSDDAVEWTFARQLLTEGVTAPTGAGDVRTWPHSTDGAPVVRLSLTSPTGSALFELPSPELIDFLTMTYASVPTGTEGEHVDVDAELMGLLRTGHEF